jgi:Cu(I)/Ag(I) efflux system periplasmic protein CusF
MPARAGETMSVHPTDRTAALGSDSSCRLEPPTSVLSAVSPARRAVLRGGLASALGWVAAGAVAGIGASAWAQAAETQGEVTRVDRAGGRIGIRHGGIAHLDMPPMTMTFRLRDPQALEGLAVGDRVRFVAERVDGQFVITRIRTAG